VEKNLPLSGLTFSFGSLNLTTRPDSNLIVLLFEKYFSRRIKEQQILLQSKDLHSVIAIEFLIKIRIGTIFSQKFRTD